MIIDQTHLAPKSLRKNKPRGEITALVLHQMGFSRGNDTEKYRRVKAHYVITPDGTIAQNHPISEYLYASNRLNKQSVAVEFAGNFPSTRGKAYKPEKFGQHELTDAQISSGIDLVVHLMGTVNLTHIFPHRIANPNRQNCPGPDIWYYIGEHCKKTFGLQDGGSGFKVGNGNPIPSSWRTWGD